MALKHAVADHKSRIAVLERQSKQLLRKAEERPGPVSNGEVERSRIAAKMIQGIKAKLGLSQKDFAGLLGVSGLAVRAWEGKEGRLALRAESKAAVIRVRKMRKREAQKRLERLKDK